MAQKRILRWPKSVGVQAALIIGLASVVASVVGLLRCEGRPAQPVSLTQEQSVEQSVDPVFNLNPTIETIGAFHQAQTVQVGLDETQVVELMRSMVVPAVDGLRRDIVDLRSAQSEVATKPASATTTSPTSGPGAVAAPPATTAPAPDPLHEKAYLLYTEGFIAHGQGNLEVAVRKYHAAIELHEDLPEPYANLGAVLLAQGQVEQAIDALGRAISLAPSNWFAHFQLGQALAVRGASADLEAAIRHAERAARLNPGNPVVLLGLGRVLTLAGEHESAMRQFRQAMAIDPQFYPAQYEIGLDFKRRGDLNEAVVVFRGIVAAKPDLFLPRLNLGLLLWEQGQPNDALAEFRHATRLETIDRTFFVYGDAFFTWGRPLISLETQGVHVVADSPSDLGLSVAYSSIGAILLTQRDWDGALAAYRKAVGLAPKTAMFHVGLGHALIMKGDIAGAQAASERAIELQPGLGAAHYLQGAIHLNTENYDVAIACYRRGLALGPDDPAFRANLAFCLMEKGDLDGAIQAYRQAIAMREDDAFFHYRLALALFRKEDAQAGLSELETALKWDPAYAPAPESRPASRGRCCRCA